MGNCVCFEMYLSIMNLNFLLLQGCAYRNQTGNFCCVEGCTTEFFTTYMYTETKQVIQLNLKKNETITAVTAECVA